MTPTESPSSAADLALEDATRIIALIGEQRSQFSALLVEAEGRQLAMATLIDRVARPEPDASSEVGALHGVDNVRAWLGENAKSARHEVVSFSPGGGQKPQTLTNALPLDEQALRRGVLQRTILLTSASYDANTRAHVEHLSVLGGQFRTVSTLPMRMLVIDDKVALLPLRTNESSLGAFVVRTPGTIYALRALFDAYWKTGANFGESQSPDARGLNSQESALLAMLADGMDDEEAARRMGVSVRTIRRKVSALSERLDARSRFQAGVNAVRAGWL